MNLTHFKVIFTREDMTERVRAIEALSVILPIFLFRHFLQQTFVEGLQHQLQSLIDQFISPGRGLHAIEILMVNCHAILLRAAIMEHLQVFCRLRLASIRFRLVFKHLTGGFRARVLHAIVMVLESVQYANQFAAVEV